MPAELDHIWSQIREGLADAIDEPVFRIWLEPLRPVELAQGKLTVEAPAQSCGWVRERFGRLLQACTAAVLGADTVLDVVDSGRSDFPGSGVARARPRQSAPQSKHTRVSPQPLEQTPENPKLTFEQFVIGDSNRLAHAAALTVSELPAQAYNPLFVCGPPGVGKTHLLRSIAAYTATHNPALCVRSTTGEAFTNEFLQALASSSLDSFKASFRRVDLLLIDDVQFLERKAKTEEEFFHTFNALYEAGSQIVLSSDRPPSDLQALEDRLRERFQSGLVADIRPPDFPTRLAILRKRAQHDGVHPSDPQAFEAIAHRIRDNVRSLEGALIRVVAYGSLTGRPLDVELATEVLDGLYPQPAPHVRCTADIQLAACTHFGLSRDELVSPARTARVAQPRQLAMYLARELTEESLPAIGRAFGGRDHTTVLHACRRIEQRISTDTAYRTTVERLRSQILGSAADRSA